MQLLRSHHVDGYRHRAAIAGIDAGGTVTSSARIAGRLSTTETMHPTCAGRSCPDLNSQVRGTRSAGWVLRVCGVYGIEHGEQAIANVEAQFLAAFPFERARVFALLVRQ